MSEEERRSNLASTVAIRGGRPQGELQVAASRPLEVHEQPLSALEPDMIDNLDQPTTCSLVVMIGGSFQMEVEKGLVSPIRDQSHPSPPLSWSTPLPALDQMRPPITMPKTAKNVCNKTQSQQQKM
jgi:hypothetical protein